MIDGLPETTDFVVSAQSNDFTNYTDKNLK